MSQHEANKRNEASLLRSGYRAWRRQMHESRAAHATVPLDFLPFLRANDGLGSCALRVYLHLLLRANRAGESWQTVSDMASELGMSDRQIQRGLKDLQHFGLVARVRFGHKQRTRSFLVPFGSYLPTGYANGESTEDADA